MPPMSEVPMPDDYDSDERPSHEYTTWSDPNLNRRQKCAICCLGGWKFSKRTKRIFQVLTVIMIIILGWFALIIILGLAACCSQCSRCGSY